MITLETIQKNIIEAIRQCGMTQTAIAKELHMSQSTIAHYVRGDILPALDTLANLCAVLDLDANEILGINQK
ncbi:MAG: helix-turn-helix transcriptional regulator [Clostridia bacterium]|jgi:transcriptional regulator with XRE-family HTH domain|nr:helix-turn-helix transcriptional regulator [Clostridia bacterium]